MSRHWRQQLGLRDEESKAHLVPGVNKSHDGTRLYCLGRLFGSLGDSLWSLKEVRPPDAKRSCLDTQFRDREAHVTHADAALTRITDHGSVPFTGRRIRDYLRDTSALQIAGTGGRHLYGRISDKEFNCARGVHA
jgi:hypothetical protein